MPNRQVSYAVSGPEGEAISPLLFGHNLEHTRRSIWQGLSANLLQNRKFCGEPTHEGVPLHWYAVGLDRGLFRLQGTLDAYTAHEGVDLVTQNCDQSVQRQLIELCRPGKPCGMGQEGLHLLEGVQYELRVALRSDDARPVRLRIANQAGRKEYWSATVDVQPGDWRPFKHVFAMPADDARARFEITFDAPGTLYVGAAALLPANHFHGMRRDVIERLKEISVPLLRWPGGNFAGEYRWKDGILPVDRRAGLKSVTDFTLRFTDNYDAHEIGTDEFIALCRELGAEPFITTNASLDDAPQDAADWVEYCNGSAETKWGKIRADRGHPEPYGVKYWSLGNEMGYGHMKGANDCQSYCELARTCSVAMRKVDPTIHLTGSGTWFKGWIDRVPAWSYEDYDSISFHWYVKPAPESCLGEKGKQSMQAAARLATRQWNVARETREYLDAHLPPGRTMAISYDEWNIWYAWYRVPMAAEGIYAAGFLNTFCREAARHGITMGAFFEPINEGAILVHPDRADLTPMGQAFALMKAHQGGKLLPLAATGGDDDIDATASASADGKGVCVTLVNRNIDSLCGVKLDLSKALAAEGGTVRQEALAALTLLTPREKQEPSQAFRVQTRVLPMRQGAVRLHIPPFGIALVKVKRD